MDADEIARLCTNMTIKEREGLVRKLQEDLKVRGMQMMSSSLVGKDLGSKRTVLAGGPWSFDNALIIFEEPEGSIIGEVKEIDGGEYGVYALVPLKMVNHWVQRMVSRTDYRTSHRTIGGRDNRSEESQSAVIQDGRKGPTVALGRVASMQVQPGTASSAKWKEIMIVSENIGIANNFQNPQDTESPNHKGMYNSGGFIFKSQKNIAPGDVDKKLGAAAIKAGVVPVDIIGKDLVGNSQANGYRDMGQASANQVLLDNKLGSNKRLVMADEGIGPPLADGDSNTSHRRPQGLAKVVM
ncbi:hypothetical protein EZV62_000902 [Acer yangbiense]|uniref:DUF4283 domain-containing protein n=1 Tax=Acer yangbiense TaxID=1000413 RepID=A0A5C7ISF4_9ROSI|nr:hypothetical protein EZV62_000902 [Acer yangbiense]